MSNILRTYMSPVFHREPANPQEGDTQSLSPVPNEDDGEQRCLLDGLLDGGIYIPSHVVEGRLNGHPHSGLFVLLAGPPGSGKSIFALELAYRLAINPNPVASLISQKPKPKVGLISSQEISASRETDALPDGVVLVPEDTQGTRTLYLSAESESWNVIDNAQKKLGWGNAKERIVPFSPEMARGIIGLPRVILYGREQAYARDFPDPTRYFEKAIGEWRELSKDTPPAFGPEVIVVDSLNVLPWKRDDVLQAIVNSCIRNVLLMIAVLDCNPSSEEHDYWEFFADLVIAFTHRFEKEYLVRKLRIVKARFQDHADGEHRLKINAAPEPIRTSQRHEGTELGNPHELEVSSSPPQPVPHPMSPFIREGGIFVFPSVHRYLSQRRKPLPATGYYPTPFEALNSVIEGSGFPTSRCTALVGARGSMKSHLAYYTMLKYLKSDSEETRALLISLRDDENAAVATLAHIWANQRDESGQLFDPSFEERSVSERLTLSETAVRRFLSEDRLEILYFWPGYISPEEFFHLVVVSADRKPRGMPRIGLAVINGLEQLGARFPLCEKEDMFVSGLITLLTANAVTTIVASGGHSAKGTVPAGLLPMADLILESSFKLMKSQNVDGLLGLRSQALQDTEAPHVVYEVIRGPGAREMRTKVLFYMGHEGDRDISTPSNPVWPGSVKVIPLEQSITVGAEV